MKFELTLAPIGVLMVVLFLLNFLIGKKKNNDKAMAFVAAFQPLLHQQFALCEPIYKDSHSSFKIYCSGRRNCKALLVDLKFRKRQDLMVVLFGWLFPTIVRDLVTLDVVMKEEDMDNFVFSLVRENELEYAKREFREIGTFTRQLPLESLPKEVFLVTDCEEIVSKFLTRPFLSLLSTDKAHFQFLHFSDQSQLGQMDPQLAGLLGPKILRFQFRVPDKDQMVCLTGLVTAALDFIDIVAATRLTDFSREKALHRRSSRARLVSSGHIGRSSSPSKRFKPRKRKSL